MLNIYEAGKRFGDTIEQKKTFINAKTPMPGAVIIIDTGKKYGHVGIVKEVYQDGTILINDSNNIAHETVGEYTVDPEDPDFGGVVGKAIIAGYYVPYHKLFDVIIDRDGNGKSYQRPESGDVRIGIVGNYGKDPTYAQRAKVLKYINKTRDEKMFDAPAEAVIASQCVPSFTLDMLHEKPPAPIVKKVTPPSYQASPPTPSNPVPTNGRNVDTEYMYFTHYDLGDVAQNDSTPCIGAAGNDLCQFTRNGGRSIALVAPKRKQYGINFRDKVRLEGDPGCAGIRTVLDEMNKRFRAMPDSQCIVRPGTNYCIRGDVAAYGNFQPAGGACRIAEVFKH